MQSPYFMEKSKLFRLLSSLDSKEREKCGDFLSSPIFNKSPKVQQLFEALNQAKSPPSKPLIYQQLYPNQPYKDSTIRLLMSQLSMLIEQFLVFQKFNFDHNYQHRRLLDVYTERNLHQFFYQTLSKAQTLQVNKHKKTIEDYFHQYVIDDQAYKFNVFRAHQPTNESLPKVVKELDIYYLATKLQYCCAILTRQNIWSVKQDIFLFDEILFALKGRQHDDIPLIKFYYQFLLLLIEKDNATHFFTFKALLLHQESPKLSDEDLRQLYGGAINYCTLQIRGGHIEYYQHLFDLYKGMIDTRIIFVNNTYIIPAHFSNIVTIGLKLGHFDWIEQFIRNNQKHLDEQSQKSVPAYSLALLFYYRQQYNEALSELLKVEYTDYLAHIRCKKLLLQTYYELNATEPLFALVGNFRGLLKRKELLSKTNRMAYRNFVNYTIRLYRIKIRGKKSLNELKGEIEQQHTIHDKKWLLDKIQALSN